MISKNLKTIIYALLFGVLTGVILTVAASVFIPQFFTDWAGSLVCPGRVEFVTFKQSYVCVTAPNSSFDLSNAMFWAIFKRFIALGVAVGFLLALGLIKLGEYLYDRREAAGF